MCNFDSAFQAYGLADTKMTKKKLIDLRISKDELHARSRSLDFNFDPNELLRIQRSQEQPKAQNRISNKLEMPQKEMPKLKLQLENKIHRFNNMDGSSLMRGKAYFHNFVDRL